MVEVAEENGRKNGHCACLQRSVKARGSRGCVIGDELVFECRSEWGRLRDRCSVCQRHGFHVDEARGACLVLGVFFDNCTLHFM